MTLGYIASFKESLATEIIKAKAINQLSEALQNESQQHIKAAACYALGKIGFHSSEHAKEVSDMNVLHLMLSYYKTSESTENLKEQARNALKIIIEKCSNLTALEPLLNKAPYDILSHILDQYIKYLKTSTSEKKQFIQNEGLRKLQDISKALPDNLKDKVKEINSYFPETIVKYYSPEYSLLLKQAV